MRFNSLVLPAVAVVALSGCTKGPTCSYTVGGSSISFSDNQGQWSVTNVVCESVALDLNPRNTVFEGSCDQIGSSDYDTYWKLVLGLYCNEQFSGLLEQKANAVLPLSYATEFSGLSLRKSCSYAEVNPFKTVSSVLKVNGCPRAVLPASGTATELNFAACTGVTGLSDNCETCFKDTVKSLASADGKCLDYAWTAGTYLSKCIDTVDEDLQHKCGFPAPQCSREAVSGFSAVADLFKGCTKSETNGVLNFDQCSAITALTSTCNSCVETLLSSATHSPCVASNWQASGTPTFAADSVTCVGTIKTALTNQCGFTWPSCTRTETSGITDVATLMTGCTAPFSGNTLSTTGCSKITALSSTCQTCLTTALGDKTVAGSGANCLSPGTYTGLDCLTTVQAKLANQCGFGWSFISSR